MSDLTVGSHFLDRKSRRTAQTATKLLCALDKVLQRRTTSKSARDGVKKHAKIYKRSINTHLNLLLRGNEDIATVTSAPRLVATNSPNEEIRLKDPRIVIAVSMRSNDTDKKNDRFEQEITLSKIDVARDGRPDPNIIRKLLADLKESINGRIAFDEHVRSYFQHLRELYDAEELAEYSASLMRVRTYVYSNCYPKMLTRLESGSRKTRDGYTPNFWEILTRKFKLMPDHAKEIPMPTKFRDKMPNCLQSKFIREAFSKYYSDGEDVFHKRPIYQTHNDRLRFQHMLRHYLLGTHMALSTLDNAMKNASEAEEARIQALVQNVNDRMVQLWRFLRYFNDFLEAHLKWLAASAKVTNFKDKATWQERKGTAVSDGDATATTEEKTSDSTTNGQDTSMTSKSDDVAPAQESIELEDEDAYDEDLNEFDRVRDEAERAQRQAGEYDGYKTWALGAVAYMTRACLHEEALLAVTKWIPGSRHARDRFEPAHIKEAKICVVEIVNARPDDESPKGDTELIATLKQFHEEDWFEYLDGDYLLSKLSILGDLSRNRMVSTAPHCEAILMSLITMAKDRQTMKDVTDDWLKSNGIFISRKDLLHMFPSVIPGVLATRPSCWLCEATREQMIKLGITKTRLFAPNSWVNCPLPAIMPRKLAEPIYEHIMRECAPELEEWQDRVKLFQSQEEQRQTAYCPSDYEPRPLRRRIKVSKPSDANLPSDDTA